MKKKYNIIIIILAAFLVIGTTIASYAYFTASVDVNGSVYDTVITSGEMALMLNDGNQVSLNNAIPGDSVEKTFSVKNTGTVETKYDIYLSELINRLEDKNDLVYVLVSKNGCGNNTQTVVPSNTGEQSKIVSSCSIKPNQTHEYSLIITFKNDDTNRDDNKGKAFSAKISVNEYNKISYLTNGNLFKRNLITAATYLKNITTIERATEEPDSSIQTLNVADETSDEEILMWLDGDKIKLYTKANEIYLNENCSYMFSDLTLSKLDLSIFNASLVNNMSSFFASSTIDEIILGDHFDTSNVTNMSYMFEKSSLASYDIVNKLNYSNAKNLYKFLGYVKSETYIELKDITFPRATDLSYMFSESKFSNIKLTNVEAPNVTNVTMFFKYNTASSIIFENSFNSTSLTTLQNFVYYCQNLTTLDLGSFNIKGVNKLYQFINNAPNLVNLNLGTKFDTSDVTTVEIMLSNLTSIEEIDLTDNFSTEKMKKISLTESCPKLKTIHLGNKFNIYETTNIYGLIKGEAITTIYIGPDAKVYSTSAVNIINGNGGQAPNLVGGAGTAFDPTKNTAEYFRIDDPDNGKPGYLTLDPRNA